MKITIIIATLNSEATLEKCLTSIISQSFKEFEIIIVDGKSSDRTLDIISKYSNNIYRSISEPDRGIYDAWNKALKISTGDWYYFMGSDDVLFDDYVLEKFSIVIRAKNLYTNLIVYGSIKYIDGSSVRLLGESWNLIKNRMKSGMCIPHQAVFHNKLLFDKCGLFLPDFRIAGDYCLILKSLPLSTPIFIRNFIVANQFSGGISSRRDRRYKVLLEFRRAQVINKIPFQSRWLLDFIKSIGHYNICLFHRLVK